ncbi:hypothetical protein PHBOTO_003427 [Pseudozyma hubeiensis]|nr:hypothetical protein PHBOTO_003427 [Pseudozyma hubeiensis]
MAVPLNADFWLRTLLRPASLISQALIDVSASVAFRASSQRHTQTAAQVPLEDLTRTPLPNTISQQQPLWPAALPDTSGQQKQQASQHPQVPSWSTGQLPSVFEDGDTVNSTPTSTTFSSELQTQNLAQPSYASLASPMQPQASVQQAQLPPQALQTMQLEPQQHQQQQTEQQQTLSAPPQSQMLPVQLSQQAQSIHSQAMAQSSTTAPLTSMADEAAKNSMYAAMAQRPPMSAHQRSISLGLHLHQLASQSVPQHSVPASAESLQAFGWPPASSQNEMLMSPRTGR